MQTLNAMIKAVADGNPVVNMSLQYVYNNTKITVTPAVEKLVDDTNDIFAKGILYASITKKDVLWVFAAGNEYGRDVRWTAPGGLVARDTNTTMAVAAVVGSGALANFSNTGELVTVAAPGKPIFSTLPNWPCWSNHNHYCLADQYGSMEGTSMAAPMVTGLAGLLKSENPALDAQGIRRCILQGARLGGTLVPGTSFFTLHAPEALACANPRSTDSVGGRG